MTGVALEGRGAKVPWAAAMAGAGLLVLLVLVLKLGPVATPAKWDECLYAYDAQRVLHGEVLYRDFFNFTPPAIFYLVAGWSKVCGGALPLTEGRYLAVLMALASWGLAERALRRASWGTARSLLLASLYPVGLFLFWPVPSHHWLGNLLFLASLEAWDFGACAVRGPWGWRWIGAASGLSLLTLQTTFVEMAAFWGVAWAVAGGRRWRAALRTAEGMVAVVAPALLAWAWVGALGAMFRDTVLWTARHYGAAGGPNAVGLLADLPDRLAGLWQRPDGVAPGLWAPWALAGTLVYVGLTALGALLLGLCAAELARTVRRRKMGAAMASAAMALTAVDAALFLRGKTDFLHLAYLLGPVALAWALALPPPSWRGPAVGRIVIAACGAAVVAALVFQLSFLFYHRPQGWEFADVDRPTREAPVNRWLRAQPWLLPEDTLAAFPEGGQVYLYTRRAGLGFTLFHPLCDLLHSDEDHREAAAQLERNRPRAILLTEEREKDYLDPVSPVAAVIGKDYERSGVVGYAVVYRRKGAP